MNRTLADAVSGRLLLRIEDIDTTRARPEFEAAILEDLDWLGIGFDGEVRRQSDHIGDYEHALQRLCDLGLIYRSDLTRAGIQSRADRLPRDPDGAPRVRRHDFPENSFDRLAGEGALRLDVERLAARLPDGLSFIETGSGHEESVAVDLRPWGDPVLKTRDGPFTYTLAVVVDDELQGGTEVVRGADLKAQTHLHRALQHVLGYRVPRWHHHRLLLDEHGEKLAKSRLSPSLRDLRAAGWSPSDVRRSLGL